MKLRQSNWRNNVPKALIYLRLFVGVLLFVLSVSTISHFPTIAIFLFSIGLISDIFDGIIARKLNISTPKLRKMDSNIDQIFFLCTLASTIIRCPIFFKNHIWEIATLLFIESVAYIISYIKFRKEIATHTIGAKIWSLIIFAILIQILYSCDSTVLFALSIWIGIFTRLEIIAIILLLKSWTTDVPTLFHAIKIRNGKPIKRNKLLNG